MLNQTKKKKKKSRYHAIFFIPNLISIRKTSKIIKDFNYR